MPFDLLLADLGLEFARALVAEEYARAHGLLSDSLRKDLSSDDLRVSYESMISYTSEPPDTVEVRATLVPPGTRDVINEFGWVFVSIDRLKSTHGCWLEGLDLLIIQENSRPVIQEIVWGRP